MSSGHDGDDRRRCRRRPLDVPNAGGPFAFRKKQNKQPNHTENQNGIESLEIDYLKRTKNQNKKINLQPIQRVGDDRCGIISAGKEEQKEEEEEEEEEGGGGGGGDDDDGGGGRE